jgi:magnesium transporter
MAKFIKQSSKMRGLPPGELVHIGEKKTEKTSITVLDYDENTFEEKSVKTVEECFPFRESPTVSWINIDGVHEVNFIEKLGNRFGVHPLTLEDIVNTDQRPKLEEFEQYLFVILKMLQYDDENQEIITEQISVLLGPNFVISFQEKPGDVFDPLRNRIRNAKGRIRKMGADYLAYALLDAIVDNYFVILEKIGERIEEMEEKIVSNPTPKTLHTIHSLKRGLIFLRKSVWPLREVINGLEKGESPLIHKTTGIYLRDVYDHTIQVIDTVETYRDMVAGMLDIYLSSISNKMNEVMKVLTIFAAIFIPLTFIVGVYGMNFKWMPELDWHWGYPMVWLVIALVSLSMIVFFRRRKWL